MADRPKRRWSIELRASGDEWEHAISVIRELAEHIESHGPACDLVQGGYDRSGCIIVTENPEMTHEKYGEALDAYLAEQRSGNDGGGA